MIRNMRGILYAALLFLAAEASPARAEWLRAESANFIVHSEGDEATLRARVQKLEEFDRLMRLLTGTSASPSPNKLHLYFVRGSGQLKQVWGGWAGFAGFYLPSPDGTVAVIDHSRREDYMTHEEILLHEYAHHFMRPYFPATYPAWYVEGFAEYVMTARINENSVEVGRFNEARASWLGDSSGWLPSERLLFGDLSGLGWGELSKFYAQSWLLTHYLLRDAERRKQLRQYLIATGRGEEPRKAFAKAFGITPSELKRRLTVYVRGGMTFTRLPRLAAAETPRVEIVPLPGASDPLMLAEAATRLTRTNDTDKFLQQVRAAADDDGSPLARRVLARAEALYGDGDKADGLLDPLLAEAPSDVELLYLKGVRHLTAGRRDAENRAKHFREAQRWFTRAHRADENHSPTLYRYAESLSLEPTFLSENTVNVLLLAHDLAPQVREITLSAANVLLRRGDFGQAEALLTPLAADRHGRALAKAARSLLGKARARDNRGLPDPFDMPEEED